MALRQDPGCCPRWRVECDSKHGPRITDESNCPLQTRRACQMSARTATGWLQMLLRSFWVSESQPPAPGLGGRR
eukprot:7015663-Alexandrium_andersonii.AAC.1